MASSPPLPNDEPARLESLLQYQILDTAQDEQLDELTNLTAQLFQVPIALITILDQHRQWFKANVGLSVQETQRSISFCQYTIMGNQVVEVADAQLDERFIHNPLVTQQPFIRYYCGAPLVNEAGYPIGSLALLDRTPRQLSAAEKKKLQLLAQQVINFFELNQKRKQLQAEKQHLEEKVLQRTAQLEKLNASKDKFFSIIAHDLLSPVSGVLGSADILANQIEGLTRQEIQQFARGIVVSGQQLKRLLTNLLEWASMQTGEMPFQPKPILLRQLVSEVTDLLQENARQKNLTIDNRLEESLQLQADEHMLQSILRNLLANAIKFSFPGGSIALSGKLTPTQVLISVHDTGGGMNKTLQDRLFRMDVKNSLPGTSGEKGTGLGLLLCQEFVQRHGGKIWVESQEGKGSTFTFSMPCYP
jgi:signal transduction histidine kinase